MSADTYEETEFTNEQKRLWAAAHPRPGATPRPYRRREAGYRQRCGECFKAGHNCRTCPQAKRGRRS